MISVGTANLISGCSPPSASRSIAQPGNAGAIAVDDITTSIQTGRQPAVNQPTEGVDKNGRKNFKGRAATYGRRWANILD